MIHISPIEISGFEERYRAKLINSLSGFKPANLIGTKSAIGVANLAIISSIFHLGASPPLFGMILRPDSVRRDTLGNIRSQKVFTVNHVHEGIYKPAHQTSARYDEGISEFDACHLEEQYLDGFSAPFVKDSKIKFSAKLLREELIPENNTHLLISQIIDVYLPEQALQEDGAVDIGLARTITVSGLDAYYACHSLGRLSYAKPDKDLQDI